MRKSLQIFISAERETIRAARRQWVEALDFCDSSHSGFEFDLVCPSDPIETIDVPSIFFVEAKRATFTGRATSSWTKNYDSFLASVIGSCAHRDAIDVLLEER